MGDMYDSATVQVIDREIEKLLHKGTAKKTRFSSFEDLFQNLAEPQSSPSTRANNNNFNIKQEPIEHMYIEDGAVPLAVESDDEEIYIANPIRHPVLDREIKQERRQYEEKEEKIIIEGVFDQLYHTHIKTEEEMEPPANHYFDEQIEQHDEVNDNDEYDESNIDDTLNNNIPTESQENNITKELASVNSQSNTDFLTELDSHQTAAQSPKIRLRSTPNNSNNNSMLIEERPSQLPDPIIDEPLIDLNGDDNNDDKPANESQEVYITGMNIKRPIIKDIFNDDDDFQSPVKKNTNVKKDHNKKPTKNAPTQSKEKSNNNVDINTKQTKSIMKKPETKITIRSEPAKSNNEKKSADKAENTKKKNTVVNQDPNTEKKSNTNNGSAENNSQISISRSKRRVVLENMNKKYTDETKIVDGYFPNKQVDSATITNNKKKLPTKKGTSDDNSNAKILQQWTLYCWGRRGFMHHIEFSVPLLKHRNLLTYYKTLLNENRPRIQVEKIRASTPSHIHVLSLDVPVITYIITLGDKLTLNKQTAFFNKRGIQYKGRLYKSIEEWSSACLKETSSPELDLSTLLNKIQVNNKSSFKQTMAKANPPIQIMKSHLFLKRNVNRFVEVARKRSGNKKLFSNLNDVKWSPEEEPARYIYPTDYKNRVDLPIYDQAKKRKISASEPSNERPKKKQKTIPDRINNGATDHSNPYLTRRNKDSEAVVVVANEPKEKKAADPKPKKKQKPIEEKPPQKQKESPIIKEKVDKPKEKPKEKPKKPKEVREKERESPILERAENSTKNKKEIRVEKPKPVISIHRDYISDINGTNNKNTNGTSKGADKDSRSSLRELTSAQNKKKKSTWLQNIKPANNNNDLKASNEIPKPEPKINLTASSEKQIVIEDDAIYNEFFS